MDQVKIGKFIADNRKARGMTQAELAERLGITNKAVSKWETGKCLPDAELFQPLCGLLGITVNELLLGETIPPEQAAETAEKTIVSLAGENQRRLRWKQLVKYGAMVIAAASITANVVCILSALNVIEYEPLYSAIYSVPVMRFLLMLELFHLAAWGIVLETDRDDRLAAWITLIHCAAMLVSAPLGIAAVHTAWETFVYKPVILTGLPVLLPFFMVYFYVFGWRTFYVCAGLAVVGIAVSIRNLASAYKKRRETA